MIAEVHGDLPGIRGDEFGRLFYAHTALAEMMNGSFAEQTDALIQPAADGGFVPAQHAPDFGEVAGVKVMGGEDETIFSF